MIARIFFGLVIAFWFSAANASQVTVSPTLLVFEENEAAKTVTLSNRSDEEVFYQVQLFAWQKKDGKRVLLEQQNLVAAPSVVAIPPNTRQLIRILNPQPNFAHTEQAFRLIISEIPDPDAQATQSKVRMLLRISLPVFVAGNDNREVQLTANRIGNTLFIHNSGNHYAQLINAQAHTNSETSVWKEGLFGYVLANNTTAFEIPNIHNEAKAISFIANGVEVTLPILNEGVPNHAH